MLSPRASVLPKEPDVPPSPLRNPPVITRVKGKSTPGCVVELRQADEPGLNLQTQIDPEDAQLDKERAQKLKAVREIQQKLWMKNAQTSGTMPFKKLYAKLNKKEKQIWDEEAHNWLTLE